MPDQIGEAQKNPVLEFAISPLLESNSIGFLFVSSFILLNNFLWNSDTDIVEFGLLHDEILSVL
jgi:hypothetical protein